MFLKYIFILVLIFLSVRTNAQNNKGENSAKDTGKTNQKAKVVFEFCDILPSFPGGKSSYDAYVKNNLKYPKGLRIQGTVYVRIMVLADGTVVDPEVLKDFGGGSKEAALDLIKGMPKWIPGKKGDHNVAARLTIHIPFVEE